MRRIPGAPSLLLAALVTLAVPRTASSLPLYAARTGNMCSQCHFDPNGGGPRNDFGFNFAKNRHSLAADTTGEWKDLDLTNRIGDKMPVYFGLNQRFMLLANHVVNNRGNVDRLAFFNMENAFYVTFKPHPRLTLVYSRDAFSETPDATVDEKDAFGMVNLTSETYVKLGRFRNPFGLRMDDHTVATRNSFMDFSTGQTFLPYDPRYPDMGVELGGQHGIFFGRAAFTNGTADVFGGNAFAETKAIKLGYNLPWYQGGVSFYDRFEHGITPGSLQRASRWAYYGLAHYGPIVLLGEVGAGTDQFAGLGTTDRNLLAWWAEADWAPGRSLNLRARYDYADFDRSSDQPTRDANTNQRYSLEGEWVPVPFAELRLAARHIAHQETVLAGNDENQYLMQAHFSY